MNWITASELAQMQTDIETLLPHTCDILSLTYTSDGQGGMVETWGTAYAGISCRVDYKTGKETVTSGALNPYHSAIISLPHDTTIDTGNRVQSGANVFSVQSVNAGQSDKAVTRVTAEVIL